MTVCFATIWPNLLNFSIGSNISAIENCQLPVFNSIGLIYRISVYYGNDKTEMQCDQKPENIVVCHFWVQQLFKRTAVWLKLRLKPLLGLRTNWQILATRLRRYIVLSIISLCISFSSSFIKQLHNMYGITKVSSVPRYLITLILTGSRTVSILLELQRFKAKSSNFPFILVEQKHTKAHMTKTFCDCVTT